MTDPLLESHNAEAINAIANAEEAKQKLFQSQINSAVEEGFKTFVLSEAFSKAIKTTVNGKIDKIDEKIDTHNTKHEKDMVRIMPVIEAYESAKADVATATKGGKLVLRLGATVTALGGVYLVMRMIFFNH